jgi:hypothetical protein
MEEHPCLYASITLRAASSKTPTDPVQAQETSTASSPAFGITMTGGSPFQNRRHPFPRLFYPIQVECTARLGRPRLQLGEYRGPAISFSEGGGKVWAAICADESDIGIDVAGADEFQGDYPISPGLPSTRAPTCLKGGGRRFQEGIRPALVYQGSRCQGAGMWISSRGSQQIMVYHSSAGGTASICFGEPVTGKAMARFPPAAGRSCGCVRFLR